MTGTSMLRLVVVDDDGDLAHELAGLFTDVGHEVTGVATAAQEGIDLVERTRPDVVLMDIRMQGMSGTEAAGVLRRKHPGLPVVLLSAYSDEGIVKAAREAHAAAYLVKGCTARELLSTVGTVVKESRAKDEAANDPGGQAT
jgi:CheY-like chemotaxis protein